MRMYEAAVLAQGFVSVPVYSLHEYRRRIGNGDAFVLLVPLLSLPERDRSIPRLRTDTGWEREYLIDRLDFLQSQRVIDWSYVGPDRIRASLCLEEPEERPMRTVPSLPAKTPIEARDPYAEVDRAMQVAMDNYAYRTQRSDYVVLKQLLVRGIPLDFIVEGIHDVFRTHKEPRRIRSFAYVAEILKDRYAKELVKTMPVSALAGRPTAAVSGARDPRYDNFYKLFPDSL